MAKNGIRESLKSEFIRQRIPISKKALDAVIDKYGHEHHDAQQIIEVAIQNGDLKREPIPDKIEVPPLDGLGSNVIVIAPHAVINNDDHTGPLARQLAKSLNGYAVINEKYRRPCEGEQPDLEGLVLDLNDTGQCGAYPKAVSEFISPIYGLVDRIKEDHGNVLILLIHGIADESIEAVSHFLNKGKASPDEFDILLGFGQNGDDKSKLTAHEDAFVKPLIDSLRELKIEAAVAPNKSVGGHGPYCAAKPENLNQELGKLEHGQQSIQLEVRMEGFRNDRDIAKNTGEKLARAIRPFTIQPQGRGEEEGGYAESDKPLWPTSAKDAPIFQIGIGEIDLTDTTFQARVVEFGHNIVAFNELVESIKANGIQHNIIVRRVPGRDPQKFQLISGFRRISAFIEVCAKQGKADTYGDELVWAKVYDEDMTDEEAYQIAIAENMQREKLSMWELVNFCRSLRDRMVDDSPDTAKGIIEANIARLIQKEPRTVRRYIQIGEISDANIRREIHKGEIDISKAELFVREGFSDEDQQGLYRFYRGMVLQSKTPSVRELDRIVRSVEEIRRWSNLSVSTLLGLPTAELFLKIKPDDLKKRVESRQKSTGQDFEHILAHDIAFLTGNSRSQEEEKRAKPELKNVFDKTKYMEEKVQRAIEGSGIDGDVRIIPTGEAEDRTVQVAITGAADNIPSLVRALMSEAGSDFDFLADFFRQQGGLPENTKKKSKKKGRFNDWTDVNINFCTGCVHQCRYCYQWEAAVRLKQIESREQWPNQVVREHDVKANYPFYKNEPMIGFPSSHDITPEVIEEACIVLGKLLRMGNRVLIVSKPHMECIERICSEFERYKEQILFRFTITAMDDNLLAFWEPYAPKFDERKACLEYAFSKEFETSVSAEPMLDTAHVDDLIADLLPLITDAIWLGTMNDIKRRVVIDSEATAQEVAKIEAGQTEDIIRGIYERHKGNIKVKYKHEINKMLGLPLPEKPGMDV